MYVCGCETTIIKEQETGDFDEVETRRTLQLARPLLAYSALKANVDIFNSTESGAKVIVNCPLLR